MKVYEKLETNAREVFREIMQKSKNFSVISQII